jgi:hypothetical protein
VWHLAGHPVHDDTSSLRFNEFMLVLQGSVTLVNTGGGETTVRAGESFVVPQGWDGYWKQLEFFRKFAFSFRNPSWRKPSDPTALNIVKLDHKARLEPCQPPPAELLSGPLPVQHAHEWFVDVSGQLAVGVHDTTAFHQKPMRSPRHDWRHVGRSASPTKRGRSTALLRETRSWFHSESSATGTAMTICGRPIALSDQSPISQRHTHPNSVIDTRSAE